MSGFRRIPEPSINGRHDPASETDERSRSSRTTSSSLSCQVYVGKAISGKSKEAPIRSIIGSVPTKFASRPKRIHPHSVSPLDVCRWNSSAARTPSTRPRNRCLFRSLVRPRGWRCPYSSPRCPSFLPLMLAQVPRALDSRCSLPLRPRSTLPCQERPRERYLASAALDLDC